MPSRSSHPSDRTALLDDIVAVGTDPTSADGTRDEHAERTPATAVRVLRRVWLWPSLVMAVAGLWHIGRPEMWQDELVSIDVATPSWRGGPPAAAQVCARRG